MTTQRIDKFTNNKIAKDTYSDFFTNFNVHPNNGVLLKRTDIDSVNRSLRNLFLTDRGERFFSDFGGNIRRFLFEPASDVTTNNMIEAIREAIASYEKRISVVDVVVTLSDDESTYTIDVHYITINNPTVIVFNVQLDRVR